jgi:hypothetical protein
LLEHALSDQAQRSHFRIALEAESSEEQNKTAAAYPSDRPSFPPSPRAWSVILGAADGPIGCALIFWRDVVRGASLLAGCCSVSTRHFPKDAPQSQAHNRGGDDGHRSRGEKRRDRLLLVLGMTID